MLLKYVYSHIFLRTKFQFNLKVVIIKGLCIHSSQVTRVIHSSWTRQTG